MLSRNKLFIRVLRFNSTSTAHSETTYTLKFRSTKPEIKPLKFPRPSPNLFLKKCLVLSPEKYKDCHFDKYYSYCETVRENSFQIPHVLYTLNALHESPCKNLDILLFQRFVLTKSQMPDTPGTELILSERFSNDMVQCLYSDIDLYRNAFRFMNERGHGYEHLLNFRLFEEEYLKTCQQLMTTNYGAFEKCHYDLMSGQISNHDRLFKYASTIHPYVEDVIKEDLKYKEGDNTKLIYEFRVVYVLVVAACIGLWGYIIFF